MTILCTDTLIAVLDALAEGEKTAEASEAIGSGRRILFHWLRQSENAGLSDPLAENCQWFLSWNDRYDWFHAHYRQALAMGKAARKSPLRADLEARLAAKRAEQQPQPMPQPRNPLVAAIAPPVVPAPVVPAYAYRRAPSLDTSNSVRGVPAGGYLVTRHVVSESERRAGTVEVTPDGIIKY